jgi:diguanylate cyclase (GGDEF)-like protein
MWPDAEIPSARRGAVRALVLVLGAVLGTLVLVVVIASLPEIRGERGFDPLIDGWLEGTAYVLAAALCLLRPAVSPTERRVWRWIGLALAARAVGFVLFLSYVRWLDPVPYPSAADAAWLAGYVLLAIGLVVFGLARIRRATRNLLLDAAVGALAIAAISIALLHDTLVDLTGPGVAGSAVAVNLAYPIAGIAVLIVLLGVLASLEWRPPAWIWMLAAGVAGVAILDGVSLYQVAAGTFQPGSALSSLSLVSTAVIAASAWAPGRTARAPRHLASAPRLVLPAVFTVACLGLLVGATFGHVPLVSVGLAAAGILVATVRTGLSFRDVAHMAELRRESRTDELTGLANRRAFDEALERALVGRDRGRPLALLLVDLDAFREINDTFGHAGGDELLRLVAPQLRIALRAEDLVARIGGDEFGVLIEDADAVRAEQVSERLRTSLARPFRIASRDVTVSASVGAAVFPDDGPTPFLLLERADLNMYRGKAAVRGSRIPGRVGLDPATRERQAEIERLRRGIEADELVLRYQPQVSLTSGRVVGVEALVRWERPEAGLLPPAAFLPTAEGGGLMRLLTLRVLEGALRRCAAWRAEGRAVRVSVNLSVTNLLDAEFPDQVGLLIDACGVPGDAVVLELTEDLFLADPTRGAEVIAGLARRGVRIAIDDYGTGFSSLGYLRDLRDIGGLKLDRSFVSRIEDDPRTRAIVGSTIALSHSLGLEVVAEGVETEAVRDRLPELGCTLAQGFLFSRPVPAEEVPLDVIDRARARRGADGLPQPEPADPAPPPARARETT